MNLSFNTGIFTKNCDYIFELGNIYAAKAQIDAALTEIMPDMQQNTRVGRFVGIFMEALDDLKYATKNCINEMEKYRKDMYTVCKKMILLRDGIRQNQMEKAQ